MNIIHFIPLVYSVIFALLKFTVSDAMSQFAILQRVNRENPDSINKSCVQSDENAFVFHSKLQLISNDSPTLKALIKTVNKRH